MKSKLKGFTLVELVVVMALISILSVAIINIFKPMREVFVDTTQYETQRTAQNGIVQYITESVRYSTDLGVYNNTVTSAQSAVDAFASAVCVNNSITDASNNPLAPYDSTEAANIKNEIKKYAEVIIIDNKTEHTYGSKTYWGRLIRRKFPATPSASVPADPSLTSGASDNWRIALSESYYGGNTYTINITVKDDDPTPSGDGISDDGVLNIAVSSTRNGKRDISNAGKETNITGNITRGGVLCRNLVGGNSGVIKQGAFDVSKYNGSSATKNANTYIVFLNKDGKDKVNDVIKAAAATP